MKLLPFVIADKEKCTGCRVCEIACHSYHHNVGKTIGTVTGPIIPKLFVTRKSGAMVPVQCHQCEGAPCARACARKAILMEGGRLVIDTGQCNNCRDCIEACPFEVINLAPAKAADPCVSSSEGEVRLVGNKCDLCLGREQGPVCVAACPYQALRVADPAAEKREKNRQAAYSSQYLYRMGR